MLSFCDKVTRSSFNAGSVSAGFAAKNCEPGRLNPVTVALALVSSPMKRGV